MKVATRVRNFINDVPLHQPFTAREVAEGIDRWYIGIREVSMVIRTMDNVRTVHPDSHGGTKFERYQR